MTFGTVVLLLLWPGTLFSQVDELSPLEKRPPDVDPVTWHTADPSVAIPFIEQFLPQVTRPADQKFGKALLERLRAIEGPRQVRLSLQEALNRAVTHNLAVRVQSYAPGIATASLVQAEAAFDATFFSSFTKNKTNQPSGSQLVGSTSDVLDLNGGIRKPLPTGGQLSTSLQLRRVKTDLRFQQVNPQYTEAFVAEFTQPLLRNAGLDFNRSQIVIASNDVHISREVFHRQVRETLYQTEQRYWQLVLARREVAINARLLTEYEKTYDFLWQRRDFDTYKIQLAQTKANLESTRANFVRLVNNVRDAEDSLLATLNDPELDLATELEIIPTDNPTPVPLLIDRLAEVQAALDHRTEVAEARLRIKNAQLRVGQAKNQAQPRLDLTFRYTVDGLGTNADDAFDQVTQHDFIEYFTFLDLEVPIGNRARQAEWQRQRLLHAQEIAALKNQIEQVILEVNVAVRNIQTSFDQIEPTRQSADANEDQVASVVARAERKDYTALNQELSARQQLANSRSALLRALVDYNTAIIALERAKDTLVAYDNIVLEDSGE